MFEAFDLLPRLKQKDYSKFLFEKCEELINNFTEELKDNPGAKLLLDKITEFAKLKSEIIMKELKQ